MAPPHASTARRASSRSAAPAAPSRRPALRIFEPQSRRRAAPRRTWLVCGTLLVGSLLAVVVGDTLLDQGQVRLSGTQQEIAAATVTQKAAQVAVAAKAAPPVIVKAAEAVGMVSPSQVVLLPRVSLDVPLPTPDTTPLSAPPATSTVSATSGSTASSSST